MTSYKDQHGEEYAIQYRFTAYLKASIAHQKAKYLSKLYNRQNQELSYEEHAELFDKMQRREDKYFSDESGNDQLKYALDRLKERERMIVFRRVLANESFIKIATDMGIAHVTVKAIYRRALEKIRKEMSEK